MKLFFQAINTFESPFTDENYNDLGTYKSLSIDGNKYLRNGTKNPINMTLIIVWKILIRKVLRNGLNKDMSMQF